MSTTQLDLFDPIEACTYPSATTFAAFADSRLPERFWKNITVSSSGCWEWAGALTHQGYGRAATPAGKWTTAHRVAYVSLVGPVGDGLELDHLCRNRSCCNPMHLEPVSHRTNLLRGNTLAAEHAVVTQCPQGHAYDKRNTYHYRGMRYCRKCRAAHAAKSRRKSRTQRSAA